MSSQKIPLVSPILGFGKKEKRGLSLSRSGDSESVKIKSVDTVTLFTAKSSERSNKPCIVRLIIALVYNSSKPA